MGKQLFARTLNLALVAFIAVAFFFAGYSARMVGTASAQPAPAASPVPTVEPPDGDPSGHYLVPKGAQAALSPTMSAQVTAALRTLSTTGIEFAVRYVATKPQNNSFSPFDKPVCTNQPQPCVEFTWPDMELTNKYADGETHDRTVDVYGTISLK